MKALQHPEQELRFTRAGQAVPFWLAAAVLLAASLILISCAFYRGINPELPHPLWAMLPLVPAWGVARLAVHLTRHAYVILTPLGVEIFPLMRPQSGMRVVYWQEIESMEVEKAGGRLTLHFDSDKTGGVHLSLAPIARAKREFLVHAMQERLGAEAKK